MASIRITENKNNVPKDYTDKEIINEILYLKSQPMTDGIKLKIQRLQQKLAYL